MPTALTFDFDVRRTVRRGKRGEAGVPARLVEIVYEPSVESDRRLWQALGILLRDEPMPAPDEDAAPPTEEPALAR